MKDAIKHLETWYRKSEQVSPVRVRTFDRKALVRQFAEWGLTEGAEIGVDGGTFAAYMFRNIPGLHLIGVDPWERDRRKRRQAQKALAAERWTELHMVSEDGAREVADEVLDFVYIDGCHRFDHVMLDLILWSPKVRSGGIVAGHDYYRFRRAGVVDAVDAYTRAHRIHEWFITDERTPSFFWIKP